MTLTKEYIDLALTLVLACSAAALAEEVRFEKNHLTDTFLSEGANAGDFNRDGHLDVVSGPYWYEGPGFDVKHAFAEVATFDPARGYSNSFFAFPRDLNGDGWTDILIIGFPGTHAVWYENPKNRGEPGHWKKHPAFEKGVDNESPTFADLTGDGEPELIFHTRGRLGYAKPDSTDPTKPWAFHPISPPGQRGPFTHALGIGDVDGDGRTDVLESTGWWRQPGSLEGDPTWEHHPADFGSGAQIYVYDVDGDGLNDVITSLQAHGYGLAWFRQIRAGDEIAFERHLIMGAPDEPTDHGVVFSQLHALDLADINGDGLKDIITGKRFWAHGPDNDPEPNAPAVLYWFRLERTPDGRARFVPALVDEDSGVGTQVVAVDVNRDGRLDLVVGNKKGTFLFIQQPQSGG